MYQDGSVSGHLTVSPRDGVQFPDSATILKTLQSNLSSDAASWIDYIELEPYTGAFYVVYDGEGNVAEKRLLDNVQEAVKFIKSEYGSVNYGAIDVYGWNSVQFAQILVYVNEAVFEIVDEDELF